MQAMLPHGTVRNRTVREFFMVSLPPMSELLPGLDGEPLPSSEWVVRVCKKKFLSKNGEITEESFVPSSEDKKDPKHRLSVYAERLTSEEQAYSFTQTDSDNAILGRLNVDDIRSLRPEPKLPEIPYLEVEWHPKTEVGEDGVKRPDTRPGAAGHSGIRDLTIGGKLQKRSLRVQLAELAQNELNQRRDRE